MKSKITCVNVLVLLALVLITPSCSTKKKSWINRQYHNTTAKYNGYFNGNESIKSGLKKIHKSHIDDYTEILVVFPEGDLKKNQTAKSQMDKAIRKGSVVIQKHSMKIKGKEYCRWIDDNYLMLGKAYFYKGDFDEATKTFNFIKSEYNKNEIRFEAALWLARAYIQKKDFTSAGSELDELFKNRRFPKKLNKDLALVAADYYLQKNDLSSAKTELINATELIKRKRKKVRLHYILAQINQYSNNYVLAKKHYKKVLKYNPDYEMAFNAKINLARLLERGDTGGAKIKGRLLKMTYDDKNKEYLDQIYYTIAQMDINNGDTLSAIENYNLSTINSTQNNPQKALSFLELGKLYFNKKSYKLSSANYDSTILYMPDDFRLFKETNEKQLILSDLVENINTIEMQDSLQMLAKLTKSELNVVISGIIQSVIEKEREEAEEKRIKQQGIYETGIDRLRNDQFGSRTSGGNWYFYNPATLSFGMSEFRKKWGTRKLEDDWRRKDKKTFNQIEVDSSSTDSVSKTAQSTKDPLYYINQIPKTKDDFKNSNKLIKEAYYKLGLIYRVSLKELDLSSYSFDKIFVRYPLDKEYSSLALYNIYINYLETKNPAHQTAKKNLLELYPSSVYAKMVLNPNYNSEVLTKKELTEINYQQVFNHYKNGLFDKVIEETKHIKKDKYKNKLSFLKSLALLKKGEQEKAINILISIPSDDEKIFKEAQHILASIKDPSKMNRANETALLGTPYLYRSNNPHMIILILPKKDVDVTYLKSLISDFHLEEIGNEVFEISALLLGIEHHILMVRSFENIKESMIYYETILKEQSVMSVLNKSNHKIMSISLENFQEFYKNKDIDGYQKFFNNNYLTNN